MYYPLGTESTSGTVEPDVCLNLLHGNVHHLKKNIMKSYLLVAAIFLAIFWSIGFFGFHYRHAFNLLLVAAAVLLLYRTFFMHHHHKHHKHINHAK
jgi:ABC-type transport system involved in cytochrome bd biosynthesis fused ATPase/permease subunit